MLKNNKKPFIYAGLIHLGVFTLLMTSFSFESKVMPKIAQPSEPIQAVTVNSNQVQAEITKIKQQEKVKQEAEREKQQHLKQLTIQAQKQQKKAADSLFQLKQQQKKLEQERIQQQKEAQHQLELIQKQHDLELKKLKELQQERQSKLNEHNSPLTQPSSEEKLLEEQINAEQKQLVRINDQQILNELEKNKALILNAIGQHWIMPPHFDPNLKTQLIIQLASNGTVLNVQLSNSSGDEVLDRSVINAIWKASPLPVPSDASLFDHFKQFRLTVRPEGFLGNSTPDTTMI